MKKEEIIKRKKKYFYCSFIPAAISLSIFLALSFYLNSSSYLEIAAKISLAIATSFFTAGYIQFLKSNTLDKNAAEEQLENIKKNNMFSPIKVLHHADTDSTINNVLKSGINHICFLGMSANYFLNNRLIKNSDSIESPLEISILLHNPLDDKNINIRIEQMKNETGYKPEAFSLKREVVDAIIKSFYLHSINKNFRIKIRLHDETPLFRLEFYGNQDLFLSFFNSKIEKISNGKGSGPVAHYKKCENEYMYTVFNHIFYKVWDRYKEKYKTEEIDTTHNSLLEVLSNNYLPERFLSKMTDDILKNDKQDKRFKEWLSHILKQSKANKF